MQDVLARQFAAQDMADGCVPLEVHVLLEENGEGNAHAGVFKTVESWNGPVIAPLLAATATCTVSWSVMANKRDRHRAAAISETEMDGCRFLLHLLRFAVRENPFLGQWSCGVDVSPRVKRGCDSVEHYQKPVLR